MRSLAVLPSRPEVERTTVCEETRVALLARPRRSPERCCLLLVLIVLSRKTRRCRIARRVWEKQNITLSGGSLGSCVDEERSQLRDLM